MTTIQEYLNQKYPTQEQRNKIEEIFTVPFFGEEMNDRVVSEACKNGARTLDKVIPVPDDKGLVEGKIDLSTFPNLILVIAKIINILNEKDLTEYFRHCRNYSSNGEANNSANMPFWRWFVKETSMYKSGADVNPISLIRSKS